MNARSAKAPPVRPIPALQAEVLDDGSDPLLTVLLEAAGAETTL